MDNIVRLIHFDTEENMNNATGITPNDIVFCKETGVISTHGGTYGEISWDEIPKANPTPEP